MANTTNYGWTKPDVGASDDVWGGLLNADLDGIDSIVHGIDIRAAGVTIADTAPSSPSVGALWWDSVGAQLYVWYNDGNTSQWTPTTNQMGGGYLPLQGVTNGSDAPPGQIGEVISSNVTTGVTLTNATVMQITSLSLTAGDWDVTGEVWITAGTGAPTSVQVAISTSSSSMPATPSNATARILAGGVPASNAYSFALRPCRVSLASTTTYYLITNTAFPSGTTVATGNIWARRAR